MRGGAKELAEHLGVSELLISIAHCRTHATAYALALGSS
jgi:holo-[acyl-carrier protein] synthase